MKMEKSSVSAEVLFDLLVSVEIIEIEEMAVSWNYSQWSHNPREPL